MRANLQNLVSNVVAAGVNSAKLAAAVRAGSARDVVTMPTAGFLPPGQFLPQLPIPEHPGSRMKETAVRYPAPATPTGPVGRILGPSTVTAGAAIHSWSASSTTRIGRDCQSPDRTTDRQDRTAKRRQFAGCSAKVSAALPAAAK